MDILHRYLNTHQNDAEAFLLNVEMDETTIFGDAPGFAQGWVCPIVLSPREDGFHTFHHSGAWEYGGKFAVVELGSGKFGVGNQIV